MLRRQTEWRVTPAQTAALDAVLWRLRGRMRDAAFEELFRAEELDPAYRQLVWEQVSQLLGPTEESAPAQQLEAERRRWCISPASRAENHCLPPPRAGRPLWLPC